MEDKLSQLPDDILVSFFLKFCRKETLRHINWANHVLGLHKSSPLEEFTVSSLFHSSFQYEVDKLLKFALSTKIQSLKIELIPLEWPDFTHIQPCLDLKRFREYLSSSPIFGFKNLKVLTLGGIDVDNQVVLKHLEIGPSLKLRHLEIYECNIDSLEICNANIASFCFYGMEKTNLLLENVTSVVNLQIEIFRPSLPRLVELITMKFTQLVKLSLEVDTCQYKITWSNTQIYIPSAPIIPYGPIRKLTWQNPYPHLKVVRYEGYLGGSADNEFITYLVEKSLALEKFIVTPCDHSSYSNKSSKVERRSRNRAWRQLQGKVPKGVELVIL
ncbi:uncharacterized protein LOC142169838 [Nicotiana tabacum]|uniref:Uncharacterized protein LOC142169838 n=1 Tax=Nicotiana tabacum TaxID=4097 RepID=A0AC58SSB0_TOBAC